MTIVVKAVGDVWTCEVDGAVVGQANTEANIDALVAALRKQQTWTPSWRFAS